jgi:regulator of protease activity HflC (stomatin/prohibitin superfamily)
VNYALDVLTARQQRDATIEQARAEARRLIADAEAVRDRDIRRLHASDPSLTYAAIAAQVGCDGATAFATLNPERHEVYRRRARARWVATRRARAAGRLKAVS